MPEQSAPTWQPPSNPALDMELKKPIAPAGPKKVRPWHEIAVGLDPMLPKEQYDSLRDNYFNRHIAPYNKAQNARQDFMSKTERAPLLTTMEKIELPAKIAATEFFAKAEEGLPGKITKSLLTNKGKESFQGQVDKDTSDLTRLHKLAAREGMETTSNVADVTGSLGEMVPELAGLEGGPGFMEKLLEGVKGGKSLLALSGKTGFAVRQASRVAHGGATFGVYDVLHARGDLGHAFLQGTAEGYMWGYAGGSNIVSTTVKHAVIGGGIGAAEAPEGQKTEGAVVGAAGGALFGIAGELLGGHTKERDLKKALTPDESKPIPSRVNDALAKESVVGANRAQMELKPHVMTLDESLRGVRVRVLTPDDKALDFHVQSYSEARAVMDVQKAVAAGGTIDEIAYSSSHSDVLNRFLKLSGDVTSVKTTPEPAPVGAKPSEDYAGGVYDQLKSNDQTVFAYRHPSMSKDPIRLNAVRENKEILEGMKEAILWTANKFGTSDAERAHIDRNLVELVNNRIKPPNDPVVNRAIKALAYKPEVRDLIPPQFLEVFDKAQLQVPKGDFGSTMFPFSKQYKALQQLAPRRTPDELTKMAELAAKLEKPPQYQAASSGSTTGAQVYNAQKAEYDKSWNASLQYPELASLVPPERQPQWNADRLRAAQTAFVKNAQELSPLKAGEKPQPVVSPKPASVEAAADFRVQQRLASERAGKRAEAEITQEQEKRRQLGQKPLTNKEQTDIYAAHSREAFGMSPYPKEDIQAVMNQEIEEKSRNIDTSGVQDEFLRTGQWERKKRVLDLLGFGTPAHDLPVLEEGKNFKIEDGMLKIQVPDHVLKEIGARAYYMPVAIVDELKTLGFENIPQKILDYALGGRRIFDPLTGNILAGPGSGMIVTRAEGGTYGDEFHELIHDAVDHAWGSSGLRRGYLPVSESVQNTADQIAAGLSKIYTRANGPFLREEAFTHAGTAIAENDAEALAAMAVADTSVQHVMDWANEMAARSFAKLRARPDWMELRRAKDTLLKIMNDTSPDVSRNLRLEANKYTALFHTTEDGRIGIILPNNQARIFENRQEAFKWIMTEDASVNAPSFTTPLEQMGVLSDSTIRMAPDVRARSIPKGDDEPWKDRMTVSSIYRIGPQWIGDIQTKLDQEFKGLELPRVYETFKAIDDAARGASVEQDRLLDLFGKDLATFSKNKQPDVFAFLRAETKAWLGMKDRFAMTDSQMETIGRIRQNLLAVDATHHVGVFNYFFKDLPRLDRLNYQPDAVFSKVDDPRKASFFQRGIMTGRFDPQDTDAGHFVNYVINGIGEKALEKPLYDLKEVMNQKYKDGGYVLGNLRKPLQQYINYMEHTPDFSQRLMNRVSEGIGNAFLKQASKINKYLPAKVQIPEKMESPQGALNKLMSLSYASAIVGRAAAPAKDVMNTFTNTLPILGFEGFSRGVANLTRAGWAEAKAAGAHLHGMNIGELYGDIYQEIPTGGAGVLDKAITLAGKMMAPSRWSHNVSRTIAYLGSNRAATEAIKGLRSGKLTMDQFIDKSGTWFLAKSERSRFLAKAVDNSFDSKELAKDIALTMTDRTQWPYRRGTQPLALRTGVGRVFGQFGTWPLNEAEYLKTLGARALEGGPVTKRALIAAGTWLAMNYAVYETLHSEGVDASKWLFGSPAGFSGGPAMETVMDLMKAPEESNEGRAARGRLLKTPLDIVPSANEVDKLFDIYDDQTGKYKNADGTITQQGIVHGLGFTPVDEKLENRMEGYDTEQRLKYELGQKPGKRGSDDLEQELLRDIGGDQ